MLRGLTRGRGHWADFPEHLHRLLNTQAGDRILFGEIPGNGELYQEQSLWSIPETAQYVQRKLEPQLRAQDQNIIVAISMGAMVASHWLKQEPALFTKAFFINTSSARHSLFIERFKPEAILLNPRFWAARDKELETLKVTSNFPERWRMHLSALRAYSATHPVHRANAIRQITAAALYGFPKSRPELSERRWRFIPPQGMICPWMIRSGLSRISRNI